MGKFKTLYICKNIFSIKYRHAQLHYVCNILAEYWKDPQRAMKVVDFTKYVHVLSVIIQITK